MSNNIFLKSDYDDHSSDEEVKTIEKINNNEIKHFKNIIKNGIADTPIKSSNNKVKPKLINKSPSKKTPLDSFGLLTNPLKNSDKYSDSEDEEYEEEKNIVIEENKNKYDQLKEKFNNLENKIKSML